MHIILPVFVDYLKHQLHRLAMNLSLPEPLLKVDDGLAKLGSNLLLK